MSTSVCALRVTTVLGFILTSKINICANEKPNDAVNRESAMIVEAPPKARRLSMKNSNDQAVSEECFFDPNNELMQTSPFDMCGHHIVCQADCHHFSLGAHKFQHDNASTFIQD